MPDPQRDDVTTGEGGDVVRRKKLSAGSSTTMTARTPIQLAAAYDAVSLVTGVSVGGLMRTALERYLAENWNPRKLQEALSKAREAQLAQAVDADAQAVAGVQDALEALGK